MATGKRYKAQAATLDRATYYTLDQALTLLKEMPHAKFDETVEIAFHLGIDTRQADQTVRGAISLPHGTGRLVRVCVIAQGEKAQAAKDAGAEIVGYEELLQKIQSENWMEFDVMIATPDCMGKVRGLGRVLGPRGLMPNPKTGTVTDNVGEAVREAKGGRVEYRADKGGCIHLGVGKVSFGLEQLKENCASVGATLLRVKPASARGVYMLSCTISSTMSPGLRIDTREFTRSTNED